MATHSDATAGRALLFNSKERVQTMTKKDYQAIAAMLYTFQDTNRTVRAQLTSEIAQRMADLMAADNPRFSRERFIEACETGKCRGMRQVQGS
jgi:hypothetical protein